MVLSSIITPLISNWSVADEIKRLIAINSVVPIDEEYDFHKDGCSFKNTTPFTEPKNFYTQQILTIFRTVYNFCTPQGKGKIATPAMKIGIANKIYNYKDILYFR